MSPARNKTTVDRRMRREGFMVTRLQVCRDRRTAASAALAASRFAGKRTAILVFMLVSYVWSGRKLIGHFFVALRS
jgi:hypothetical protein